MRTYDKYYIVNYLENKGWKVADIHIFKSNTTFKIEFDTKEVALNFLNNINTEVGGIKILQKHKETEVDPTIHQCWACGLIDPDHISQNCHGYKVCLKCGDPRHGFFDCPIPKNYEDMTTDDKKARYCILCRSRGDHSTIDSFCPYKRNIIQHRIKCARDKRLELEQTQERYSNITQTPSEFSNFNTWPLLSTPTQQNKISTILMLTLLDEAVNEGSFQCNFSKACQDNDLPNIIYTPHPNTATALFNSMTHCSNVSCTSQPTQVNLKPNNSKQNKSTTTKYFRDQQKRLEMNDSQNIEESDTDDSKNNDETSEFTNVIIETPPEAASALTENLTDLNPDTHVDNSDKLTNIVIEIPPETAAALTQALNPEDHIDNSGINTETYEFADIVNKAIEMHTNRLATDTNIELYNNNLDLYDIVDIVKKNEQQIRDYYKQGMTN